MEAVKEIMNTKVTTLDSKKSFCQGCGNRIIVKKIIMPFGPQKGKVMEIREGCICETIEMTQNILKRNKKAAKQRYKKLFDINSLIPDELKDATLRNYKPRNESQRKALLAAVEYVKNYKNETGLLMSGSFGTGKSHLAMGIAKALVKKEIESIFITVPDLLTKIKSTFDKDAGVTELEYIETLQNIDCLIIDDIGAEKASGWVEETLFKIVNARSKKHTVYTTNCTSEELEKQVKGRCFSRILGMSRPVKVEGEDYRLRKWRG